MHKCPYCGVEVEVRYDPFLLDDELPASPSNPWHDGFAHDVCPNCSETFLRPEQIKVLQRERLAQKGSLRITAGLSSGE